MKMKKRLLPFIIAAAAMFALSACGNNDNVKAVPTEKVGNIVTIDPTAQPEHRVSDGAENKENNEDPGKEDPANDPSNGNSENEGTPTPVESDDPEQPTDTPTPTETEVTEAPTPVESKASDTPTPTPVESKATDTPTPTPVDSKATDTPTPTPADSKATDTPTPVPDEGSNPPAGDSEKAKSVVALAKSKIGSEFKTGGVGPDTFDNPGLVYYCFKENGVIVPRLASGMANYGKEVSMNNLQAGDIVVFSNEIGGKADFVGIYIGNNSFVCAFKPDKPADVRTMSTYWTERFISGRRVL